MQIVEDLRYSFRLLRKTPIFTGITLLVVMLGLSLFLVSYPMSQQMSDVPMPFPDGDRYVSIKTIDNLTGLDSGMDNHDLYAFNYLSANSTSYSTLGAFNGTTFVLSDGDYAIQQSGSEITLNLMMATAVKPFLGRNFTVDDVSLDAPATMVLSHSLWQSYYLSNPNIVGQISRVNGQPRTVIGVMPEGFRFPYESELWLPLAASDAIQPGQGARLTLVGILAPNSDYGTAEAELNANLQNLITQYPEIYANEPGVIYPYASIMTASVLETPRLLRLISLLILGLAATNLSSLLFIRSSARQQELLVRSSVGASGAQLAKQVLLETFILCFIGFLLSLPISAILLEFIHSQVLASSAGVPFWYDLELDQGALFYGFLVTLSIWLVSGLLIAVKAYRSEPAALLNGSKGSSDGVKSAWVTSFVVGLEMVFSFMLLIFCGMAVFMVSESTRIDFGGETENFVVGEVNLYQSTYEEEAQYLQYAEQLQQVLTEIPILDSVALTNGPLGVSGSYGRYDLEDRSLEIERQLPLQSSIWVSDNYFESIGVEIISGRTFDAADNSDSDSVVIVSQNFANQSWPGESALGKQIIVQDSRRTEVLSVVGVIPNLVQNGLFQGGVPNLYLPFSQMTPGRFYIVGKANGQISINSLEQELVLAARTVNRDIPLIRIRTLEEEIAKGQGGIDVFARIFVGISLATLALAAIGIFGVVARSIGLRTREIGIRRALGSSELGVVFKFINQGVVYLIIGFVVGGVPAGVITASVWGSTFGNSEIAVALVLISVLVTATMAAMIFLASYIPARRAVAMDPGDALRYE